MQDETHDKHYVTTKIALFAEDYSKVVVTHILIGQPGEGYGIPGGHIEGSELPDDALRRELDEELGIKVANFTLKNIFRHRNGKIIIGYIGTISGTSTFTSLQPMIERGEWKTREEFDALDTGSYHDFVLENWSLVS